MMDLEELAYELGYNKSQLNKLCLIPDRFYVTYMRKKRNGKVRKINAPGIEIKAIQFWILRNLLEKKIVLSEYAHGFVKGRSIKTNANMHLDKKYILCLDIKDFFPSIKQQHVEPLFNKLDLAPDLVPLLTNVCCYDGFIPQGGVTSPYISNAVFQELDEQIGAYSGTKNVVYTRYADDLSFSSDYKDVLFDVRDKVIHLLEQSPFDFELNSKKEKLLSNGMKKAVTGIILNSGKLTTGRKRKRFLRATLYNYIMNNNEINFNNLIGNLAFINDIEPGFIKKFAKYKEKLIKNKALRTN